MPKVSIIYVNYKSEERLFESIASVIKSKPKLGYEVVVVDNSPKDKVSKKLKEFKKEIKYVKSNNNLGYGAGNNLGAKKATGEYLLFLNPDTKVLDDAIDTLFDFLDRNKDAAVVGPNLINKSGKLFEKMGSRELSPSRAIFALTFIDKIWPNNPISNSYYLRDIPKDKKRKVGTVPGSVFMIRKEVFEEVGGFDENMFMYFEEMDLGKRLQEKGWKLFIIPDAEVVHYWEGQIGKDDKLKKHFKKSRFYYFKKHYGLFKALMVEMFARSSKWHIALLATLLIAAFLRFFRIEENLIFHGELGHNYLAIKNAFENKNLPLLGPPTSHPWLYFGPLYYWFFAPILGLSNFNPVSGAYFIAFASVLTIILNYIVISKILDKKVALVSSFLISISPLFIILTRESRFFSLTVLFFYPFIYFLHKWVKKGGDRNLFWAGLFLGIMTNFHYTSLVLVPAILSLYILKKKNFTKKDLTKGLLGFLIPNLPFIVASARNNFSMLFKFVVWFPYRVAGFFGIIPQNNADETVLIENTDSLYDFVTRSFLFRSNSLGYLMFGIFLFYVVYLAYGFIKKRKLRLEEMLLLIFAWAYLAIFLHGNPPSHYYLPVYPIPIILVSILVVRFLNKSKLFQLACALVIISLIYLNSSHLISSNWYYRPQDKIDGNFVPYKLQVQAAEEIIDDSQDAKYSLERVGYLDHYEGDYAQNYQYLLWWKGNEPIEEKDYNLIYKIYEDSPVKEGEEVVFSKGGLVVTKFEE